MCIYAYIFFFTKRSLNDLLFSILNAAIPICIILLSVTNLIVRRCRGQTTSRSYYAPLPGGDPGASLNVPVSKYDIAQLVISFFHLGFIGFLFGWRMNEYDEKYTGIYLVVGAIGQFFAWVIIFLNDV